MSKFKLVLCTAPVNGAQGIARALVEERLAACVNVAGVKSYFIWEGKSTANPEELMIIKTEKRMVEPLMKRIRELHSYSVPEIIVLPIQDGDQPYLDWIAKSVG
jgi:periplasmic divalent cation tolerance protein